MVALKARSLSPLPLSLVVRRCWVRLQVPLLRRWTFSMAKVQAIEEETLPFYHQKHYYPVKIGQVFNSRYRVIAKLGYGAYSTVWLAWDERFGFLPMIHSRLSLTTKHSAKEYTSLKVSIQLEDNAQISPILNEVSMLQRLQSFADKDHPGLDFTRLSYDIFQLVSRSGCHYCIASKPQGNSVRTLQETFPNRRLPKLLVKSLIHRLYFSVNWLHATCGVAHTGTPWNVYLSW